MRSINTSIVALLPVGAILYVGAVQLGSGPLKDLALALFVGMAAGAYSSIFIATPLLVQLKIARAGAAGAGEAGQGPPRGTRPTATPSVPAFTEDLPIGDDPNDAPARGDAGTSRPAPRPGATVRSRPPRRRAADASYRRRAGRCAPSSSSAERRSRRRQTKSKRGKK